MSLRAVRAILIFGVALRMFVSTPACSQGLGSLTTQERKDLNAVIAGQPLDYSVRPARQRTVTAKFLKVLMFGIPDRPTNRKIININIKGANISAFDVDERPGVTKKAPFKVVFDSCKFVSFSCPSCEFQRGLEFRKNTFVNNYLEMSRVQVNGDLTIKNEQGTHLALDHTHISGDAEVWLPNSSALDLSDATAQDLSIRASGPKIAVSVDRSQLSSLDIDISTDCATSCSFTATNLVTGSMNVQLHGPFVGFNASRLKAKTASFVGFPEKGRGLDVWDPREINYLSLDNAIIETTLFVLNLRIKTLNLANITVKGATGISVDVGNVGLAWSTFNTLTWVLHSSPRPIDLDGVTFRILQVRSSNEPHPSVQKAVEFLDLSDTSIGAFSVYETQLRGMGEIADAEKVHTAMREKARKLEWRHWSTWPFGLFDFFQEYVLGYGRSPIPPMLWSLGFIVFGTFAFRDPTKMEPKVGNPAQFSGTWYSLELFLPIVDLGVAKEWRPIAATKWRVAYARVHQMAGWILVPVALAAITGIVK